MIPIARPRLPQAAAIEPYLRQIDANAWYSNHGPLVQAFQRRLEVFWGMKQGGVALVSNATVGLTLALRASGARPGSRCLMPSWTFVASAGAVAAAGLIPHFVDVRPDDWAPDPADMRRLARRLNVGAILVVAPFGAPLDLEAWDRVRRDAGVPVVIDAAAAFDTLRADGPMPIGNCPVVVSLHATKVFGVGEGGAMLSRDSEFLDRARALAVFGFCGTREARLPGTNAKMSEYTAAIGHASLDAWPETRARWQRVTDRYRAALPRDVRLTPAFGEGWVASTCTVLPPPSETPDLAEALAAEGIATLAWWGPGCHAQDAYRTCPKEALPVTARQVQRAIGLPFWQDLDDAQITMICKTFSRLTHRATAAEVVPALAEPVLA